MGEAAGSRDRELGDRAPGRDPPDLVAADLSEPQRAVRSGRDAARVARRGYCELGDGAICGNPPDVIAAYLGEPKGTVWPQCDLERIAIRRRIEISVIVHPA